MRIGLRSALVLGALATAVPAWAGGEDAGGKDQCVYVVQHGDTFSGIAKRFLGNPTRMEDLKAWNPQNQPADKYPDFNKRLVVNRNPPFARGKWTHVVITHFALGSGNGEARLYLDGRLQGAAQQIKEPFSWNFATAAIRVGVNYVGLFDDLAVFNRALTAGEVKSLHGLKKGIASLK